MDLLKRYYEEMWNAWRFDTRRSLDELARCSYRDEWQNVRCPVPVVRALGGTSVADVQRMVQSLPRSQVRGDF